LLDSLLQEAVAFSEMSEGELLLFTNCLLLRDHQLIEEDLLVRNGKVLNPQQVFYGERDWSVKKYDCGGNIVAPGFIDLQINGAFGADFSNDVKDATSAEACLLTVGKGILSHGVTSYCPTVVTSPAEVYHTVLPHLRPRQGGMHGATVLGVHVEGPFISQQKKGAHPQHYIRSPTNGYKSIEEMYGEGLKNVAIITIAPELDGSLEAIDGCVSKGIVVSVGHTTAELVQGEEAVRRGARLVTHLFNAMQSFHHRDPGLVGLLTSEKLNNNKVWYGIIADGIHTHPAALRIAYKTNHASLVLVTDAICAMGFKDGRYKFGQQEIEVRGSEAYVAGTSTLTGSVATMHKSILKFRKSSRCSIVESLEAASLHPAEALGLKAKGTLSVGSDADFVILNKSDLEVISTWIGGSKVYDSDKQECSADLE